MSRLLRADAARLLSRRFTALILLGVIVALGLVQVAVFQAVTPPGPAEVAENQARYERSHAEWVEDHEEYVQRCVADGGTPQICAANYSEPEAEDYGLTAEPFSEIGAVSVTLAVSVTALAMFLLGASSIGAEFSSGAIGNWLSFVPRRGSVFSSKLITMVIFAALAGAAATVLTLGMAAAFSAVFGGDLATLGEHAATAGRGVLVAVILAMVGFCTALITRHTAAALGVLLGYLLVFVVRAGFLQNVAWAQRLTPWSAEGNLGAILWNGNTYLIPEKRLTDQGLQTEFLEQTVSLQAGLIYWAVVLGVLVAMSMVIFRRRDVS